MADYNNSALLGGGFDFNNFLTNPLTLAGLQMLSNNSPRVGQPVNTFSGVAEIVGNAAAAQRKQQEAAAGQAAISAALQNAGFSQAEADMYAKNPEAAKIALGEKKRKDELRQQNEAWEQYKAFDQPETPPAAFDQPDVWDSVPNPLDKDQSRFNQSAAEPQAELADQLADMGRKYTGAPLNQIIPEMANGNKTVAARMLAAAKASGLSPDARMTKEMLDDPETVIPLLRAAGVGAGTGEGGLEQAHAAAVDAAAQRRAALAEQYAALPSGTATDAPYSENAEEPENEQQRPQFTQAEPSLGAALARVAQLQGGQGGQAQPDWMAGAQAQPMTTAPRPQTRTEQAVETRRDQELQNQIRKQQFLIARPGIPAGMKEAAKLELQHLYKQQQAMGPGRYSVQGIPAVDSEGNPVMVQLGESGKAAVSQLPPGVTISKNPIKVDAGTKFILLDPITRNVIGEIPKNTQEEAKNKELGKKQGEATVELPAQIATAENMLQQIEEVEKHPDKNKAVGAVVGLLPGIPYVNQDAVERIDQLKGQTFLQDYQILKGGGQITEIEGLKGERAIARLGRAKSVKEFDTALSDLKDIIKRVLANSYKKAGQEPPEEEVKGYKVLRVR
jgi:hypothetical protein